MNSQHTKKLNYGINTAFFLCGCHLHTTSLNWYFFQSFDTKIINKATNVISLTRNLSRWHPLKVLFPIFSNSVQSCRKVQTPLDLSSLQLWTQPGTCWVFCGLWQFVGPVSELGCCEGTTLCFVCDQTWVGHVPTTRMPLPQWEDDQSSFHPSVVSADCFTWKHIVL